MKCVRASLQLDNQLPVQEFVVACKHAEAAGFDQVWVSHDLFFRSGPIMVAAAAVATSRIRLGVGIMNPYSLHPIEIAMIAATLQELSGGRFLLGLGTGADEPLRSAGITHDRPLAHVRRAVKLIRAHFTPGRSLPVAAGQSTAEGDRPTCPPIYLGAVGPRMLALAGECADGVLPIVCPPEAYPTIAASIGEGVMASGRDPSAVDIAACVWASVAYDASAAAVALVHKIALHGKVLPSAQLALAGVNRADIDRLSQAMSSQAPTGADAAAPTGSPATSVKDSRMLRLGIAGTPRQVAQRCAPLIRAGVRHISFGPPLGPNVIAAIDAIGGHVLPAFGDLL